MTTMTELGFWQIIGWWTVGSVVAAGCWLVWSGQHRDQWADRAAGWWAWHWFTGGRLEGRHTILDLDDTRPVAERAGRRAGLAAARNVPVAVLAAVEYVRAGAPWGGGWTVAAAGAGVPVALTAVTLAVVHAAVRAAHYRQWVLPLFRAVWRPAGWTEDTKPRRVLHVPRNRAAGDGGVIVCVAPDFRYSEKNRDEIESTVRAKLALGDVSVNWVPDGKHGYVQFRPREQMPERAMFRDPAVRELVEKAKASAPLIGVTKGTKPVAVDLDSEAPHVLISAGTGGGKSTMIRTLTAQLMWHGADVVVIDYKRHSHQWLRGLPGVTYVRDIGEIHNQLVRLAREGDRRNRALDDVDADQVDKPKRLIVVCEELNATMAMLKMHWRDIRESGDPTTSPAITGLSQLLFMGRAVRIHVLAVAQLATAKDLGGPEMRENFAVRILARYTSNAARMLVPECNLPATTRHPGRAQVCIGGVATETQVAFVSDAEARAWVIDKRGMQPGPATGATGAREADGLGKRPVSATADDQPAGRDETLVSLREAVHAGMVGLSLPAVRSARARDPEFPPAAGRAGQTDLYRPDDLARWERNRQRPAQGAPNGRY